MRYMMKYLLMITGLILVALSVSVQSGNTQPDNKSALFERVEQHNVDNNGVNIHYVTLGDQGDTLLFLHGIPDFWYIWHEQMEALCGDYRCIAMDRRGINRSDQPEGEEHYSMNLMMSDIAAVIDDSGAEKVTLIAHDAGAIEAWYFAMEPDYRNKLDRLVILSMPHPTGFTGSLLGMKPQQDYAALYKDRKDDSKGLGFLNSRMVIRDDVFWSKEPPNVQAFVREGLARTRSMSVVEWYRGSYPEPPYVQVTDLPPVKVPVLEFHGINDPIDKAGLSGTWDWIDNEFTLVTLPGVGHNPQNEVPDRVNEILRNWLAITQK